jgi:hypothetical protein
MGLHRQAMPAPGVTQGFCKAFLIAFIQNGVCFRPLFKPPPLS